MLLSSTTAASPQPTPATACKVRAAGASHRDRGSPPVRDPNPVHLPHPSSTLPMQARAACLSCPSMRAPPTQTTPPPSLTSLKLSYLITPYPAYTSSVLPALEYQSLHGGMPRRWLAEPRLPCAPCTSHGSPPPTPPVPHPRCDPVYRHLPMLILPMSSSGHTYPLSLFLHGGVPRA